MFPIRPQKICSLTRLLSNPTMLSPTVTVATCKPSPLSTPFLHHHQPPLLLLSIPRKSIPHLRLRPIRALIIPPSSSSSQRQPPQQQQQLYQPFRPPPSPVPSQYRSLDTNSRLEVLANRLGLWFEYAPLIPALTSEGFTPATIEEITGITGVEQNRLFVAAQVRDSLVESQIDDETLSFFDAGGAELLYEIRLLNAVQRIAAARFLVKNNFDAKQAQELARAIKDYPRRRTDRGWGSFDYDLPGDCLAFMYFRQSQEYLAAALDEQRRRSLEKALEVVESENARQLVAEELEGKGVEETAIVDDGIRVPVVRMQMGELAESTVVVVLPVCKADGREVEVEAAPWESGGVGNFGIVEAEKDWRRWVVLPGWQPVAAMGRGGVAVAFDNGKVLPWRENRKYRDEAILVVTDRGRKEVAIDDGFYLVVGGGNGSGKEGLKVERGSTLKEMGIKESLGTVVLVVRPPRDEVDDQLSDEDWE